MLFVTQSPSGVSLCTTATLPALKTFLLRMAVRPRTLADPVTLNQDPSGSVDVFTQNLIQGANNLDYESYLSCLTPNEKLWRDRHDFFVSHGYELRSRYRPGWTASWLRDGRAVKDTSYCEDAIPQIVRLSFGRLLRFNLSYVYSFRWCWMRKE